MTPLSSAPLVSPSECIPWALALVILLLSLPQAVSPFGAMSLVCHLLVSLTAVLLADRSNLGVCSLSQWLLANLVDEFAQRPIRHILEVWRVQEALDCSIRYTSTQSWTAVC